MSTTFESVGDGWRRTMTTHHLSTGGTPVGDAAQLVGFSDARAFSRAFKRWAGVSPSDYRRLRGG
jgi:AraC-like DNA-binding protein